MQRRETPLPGWRNWVRWKGWRRLDTAHVLTSSRSRAERGLPWRLLGCQRLSRSTSQPELSKWSGPAYCTPQCSTVSGAARKRGRTRPWSQRWPMLRRSPGWAAAAHQEPPRSPRAAPLPQPTYQYMLSPHGSLPDYKSSSTTGVGVAEAGGSDWLWETKGFIPKAASEWSSRCLHRLCIRPLSAYRPRMLQHSPLGQRSWYREREKQILEGKGVSLSLTSGLLL